MRGLAVRALQQVPLVAVKVLKDGNRTIRFAARLPKKSDAVSFHMLVVGLEVGRVQEQKYATAGLLSNTRTLFCGRSLCQQY